MTRQSILSCALFALLLSACGNSDSPQVNVDTAAAPVTTVSMPIDTASIILPSTADGAAVDDTVVSTVTDVKPAVAAATPGKTRTDEVPEVKTPSTATPAVGSTQKPPTSGATPPAPTTPKPAPVEVT